MGTSSRTLKQKAYRELKEFFVIALYLWVVFGVLRWRSLPHTWLSD
jgi:hypothetical protein